MTGMELKKMMIKQKGWLVILSMILLKIFLFVSAGYESNPVIEHNTDGYKYYMDLYGGKLTGKTEEALKSEYRVMNSARSILRDLQQDYQNGNLTESEYREKSDGFYEKLKNRSVFNIVYNQYYYAKEDPANRYLLDVRGWDTLLSGEGTDIALMLCILILSVPVFGNEYETEMDYLLLSSRRGKYRAAAVKLFLSMFVGAMFSCFFTLIEYMYLAFSVGLPSGSFPLKSLEYFQTSPYTISLNGAFILVLLLRAGGAVLFAEIISLVSILSKKSIVALFISSSLVVFPYFLQDSIKYYLPLPSGLLSGTGYLWGTSYTVAYNEQWEMVKKIRFHGINIKNFRLIMAAFVLEAVLLFGYCMKKYSRFSIRRRFGKKAAVSVLGVFILCISAMGLTGCGKKDGGDELFTFNVTKGMTYGETSGYAVSLDATASRITAVNEKTGEEIVLTRNPFGAEGRIPSIFVRDGFCYYLMQEEGGFRIFRIGMNRFDEKLVYNNVKENQADFFGLLKRDTDLDVFKNYNVHSFFLNGDYIYYINYDGELIRIDRERGRESVVTRDVQTGYSVSYYNGDIYYVDTQYRLSRFSGENGQVKPVGSIYTDSFLIRGKKIEYKDLLMKNQTKYYNLEPSGGQN